MAIEYSLKTCFTIMLGQSAIVIAYATGSTGFDQMTNVLLRPKYTKYCWNMSYM